MCSSFGLQQRLVEGEKELEHLLMADVALSCMGLFRVSPEAEEVMGEGSRQLV